MKNLFLILIIFFVSIGQSGAINNQKPIPKDIIIIEAESTSSDLGLWKKITPGMDNFVDGARGEIHLEFTGNTKNGGQPNSPLKYAFKVPEDGSYQLLIRCRKRLAGEPGDKCNDGWVKMLGDFESGNTVPEADLRKEVKFYGGDETTWGWAQTLDGKGDHGHYKKEAIYKLKAGEEYTLVVAGRSIRWNMDAIVLFNTKKHKVDRVKKTIDPEWIPDMMKKWNTKLDGYVSAYYDLGNRAMAINTVQQPTDKWAAATWEFGRKSGKYELTLVTLLESDGECFYNVFVNDKKVMSFQNPRIHGTDTPEYEPHRETVKDVTIDKGDIIKVEFMSNSNGLVPEGNAFGYARARWQNVLFKLQQ